MFLIRKIFTQIKRKRFKKTNQFDDTNHFGKKTRINHSSWGKYSGANTNCFLNRVKVGNYVSIASHVKIGLGRHRLENFTTYHSPVLYDSVKDNEINYSDENYLVVIGHDVWIGENIIINNGCHIGNGAVIAGGSVVCKSVPPFAIVGGNPAKLIKYRFSDEIIEELNKVKWWEQDLELLRKNKKKLQELVGYDRENFMSNYWKPKKEMVKTDNS